MHSAPLVSPSSSCPGYSVCTPLPPLAPSPAPTSGFLWQGSSYSKDCC
jgi:hypothetical protein